MTDETLIHDLQCNHVALHRDGETIYSRAIAEVQRLTEERDAYRYLAVSVERLCAGTLRVAARDVDAIVRARLAQRKAKGPTS